MKHIVFYSGGIGSWGTAKRIIEKEGKENVILLFTDTLAEDKDLYRFLEETVAEMGAEFVSIAEGRTPWEVFKDKRWLGNSRIAQCSHILKQEMSSKWIKEHFRPDECILYLGIDWTEIHRTEKPVKNWAPYKVKFPLCEPPYTTKDELLEELKALGIEIPLLYKYGFSHNNCAGMCIKGGQGHFINLLKSFPDRFEWMENYEKEMREYLQKDVSILTRTKNGQKENFTLEQLRKEYEEKPDQLDLFDMGGCGCMIDDDIST